MSKVCVGGNPMTRDGNGSGQARIVPTCNPTRKKKFARYPLVYPPSIRLKSTRGYF